MCATSGRKWLSRLMRLSYSSHVVIFSPPLSGSEDRRTIHIDSRIIPSNPDLLGKWIYNMQTYGFLIMNETESAKNLAG